MIRQMKREFLGKSLFRGGLFVILFTTSVWIISRWLLLPETDLPFAEVIAQRHEFVRTILVLAAMLVAIFFSYMFSKRVKLIEKQLASSNESQITERFTHAIEQLGASKLELQLAGIYTLEWIARASMRDYWAIMEILTAYVRKHAFYDAGKHGRNGEVEMSETENTLPQVQAILTVIGRRQGNEYEIQEGKVINLRRTNLAKLDLRRANLAGVNLRGVNLHGANLTEANLMGAFLAEADLRETILVRANLTSANLTNADLTSSNLREVELANANLSKSLLKGAFLVDARLEAANFTEANLEESNLSGVGLRNVNLFNTRLRRVKYDQDTDFPDWMHFHLKEELGMQLAQ